MLKAEWIGSRQLYRLYDPKRPEDTVAYMDRPDRDTLLDEAEEHVIASGDQVVINVYYEDRYTTNSGYFTHNYQMGWLKSWAVKIMNTDEYLAKGYDPQVEDPYCRYLVITYSKGQKITYEDSLYRLVINDREVT